MEYCPHSGVSGKHETVLQWFYQVSFSRIDSTLSVYFTGRYNVDDEELPALTDVVAHQHSLVSTELSMDGASVYGVSEKLMF